jgi:hypothetical protein
MTQPSKCFGHGIQTVPSSGVCNPVQFGRYSTQKFVLFTVIDVRTSNLTAHRMHFFSPLPDLIPVLPTKPEGYLLQEASYIDRAHNSYLLLPRSQCCSSAMNRKELNVTTTQDSSTLLMVRGPNKASEYQRNSFTDSLQLRCRGEWTHKSKHS